MEREPTIQTVSQLSSHSGTETGGRREINEEKKKVFLRRKSRSCWIKWFKDRINIKKKKKKASVMSTPQGCTTLFFFLFHYKDENKRCQVRERGAVSAKHLNWD